MKKLVLFLILPFAGIGLWLAGQVLPIKSCTTEELARALSPDKSMTAIYQNAVCTSAPDLLDARVLIAPGASGSQSSWSTVFSASTSVDRQLSRLTQVDKIKIRWLDATTLAVDTTEDLVAGDGASRTLHPEVRLVVNSSKMASQPPSALLGPGLGPLQAALSSRDENVIANQVFTLLYENFGNEQYWPVVNALWQKSESEYPNFNWRALNAPVNRLKIAGLWGQWSRELRKDRAAVDTAAAFARSFLAAEAVPVRLEAISALGSVGSVEDRDALVAIATGDDKQAAVRAVTAIFAIERIYRVRESVLPSISERAKHEEVRAVIDQLRAVGQVKLK